MTRRLLHRACHMACSLMALRSLPTQFVCHKATKQSRHATSTALRSKGFALSRLCKPHQQRGRQEPVSCCAAAANISLPSPDGGEQLANSLADWPGRSSSAWCNHAGSIPFNPSPEGSAFLAKIKGFLFYSFTLLLSVPLFVSMLVMTPFVLLLDKYRYVPCSWQILICC